MNEPSDATHYQIALTNRQVLAALGTLLACYFVAFFAGVWLGRASVEETVSPDFATVAAASEVERLDFFTKTDVPQRMAPPPMEPAPKKIEDKPAAVRKAAPTPVAAPSPIAAKQESPRVARSMPPPEPMKRPAPRIEPASGPDVEEAPQAPEVAAALAPTEDGFFVQVIASADRDKAQTWVDRLLDQDFEAQLVPVSEGDREVFRVRVGPFRDRELAQRRADEIQRRWELDPWIPPGAP